MINKLDFKAKNLTSNAGLFLLLENEKNGIFQLIENDLFSGVPCCTTLAKWVLLIQFY